MIYQALSYIKYLLRSRHFRGDGVHSPFVFHLINFVFREKNSYYIYSKLESVRESLLRNHEMIYVTDFGAGSSSERKISEIAQKSLKNKKYSQLLFRLVNYLKPQNILELGTSLGLTTMYLAASNSKARCVTIEGSPEIHKTAQKLFQQNKFNNIESWCGNIDEKLPLILENMPAVDFVFFDANHREEATLSYFAQCLEHLGKKSVFIFDDIYWSKGMTRAWEKIKQHPKVKVSIDIYAMGIVFFDEELQKGDYILRY